jgi:hypothetical protein
MYYKWNFVNAAIEIGNNGMLAESAKFCVGLGDLKIVILKFP